MNKIFRIFKLTYALYRPLNPPPYKGGGSTSVAPRPDGIGTYRN